MRTLRHCQHANLPALWAGGASSLPGLRLRYATTTPTTPASFVRTRHTGLAFVFDLRQPAMHRHATASAQPGLPDRRLRAQAKTKTGSSRRTRCASKRRCGA